LEELNQLVLDKKPLPRFALPGTLKAHAQVKRTPIDSNNVVGMIEGSDPKLKSEYVIMSAHLDHTGVGRAVNGDTINNGAMEDAKELGVAVQTDREPEQNRFIRSDQYSFIRRGVPSLAFKFGYEFGSPEETIRRNWVRDIYHKPQDDTNQPVNLEAAAKFNRVIMGLLQRI